MKPVSKILKKHYEKSFAEFGANSKGVDWGNENDVFLRYKKMLEVIRSGLSTRVSIFDVGCGYGGLLDYAKGQGFKLDYSGIDVAENMIAHAKENHEHGEFYIGDILDFGNNGEKFDYVVCNGILTQKLEASIKDMDGFANNLIQKMFELCSVGIAFNIMSNKVNFMVDNLYYRSPVELLSYCFDNLSAKVRLDHAYPLYEYTVYVYRE